MVSEISSKLRDTQGKDLSKDLALGWRGGTLKELCARLEQGLPQENIDVTHRRVLDALLETKSKDFTVSEEEQSQAVQA